jgi:hypothetical protein
VLCRSGFFARGSHTRENDKLGRFGIVNAFGPRGAARYRLGLEAKSRDSSREGESLPLP